MTAPVGRTRSPARRRRTSRAPSAAGLAKILAASTVLGYCTLAYIGILRSIANDDNAGAQPWNSEPRSKLVDESTKDMDEIVRQGRRFPPYGTAAFERTCNWTLGSTRSSPSSGGVGSKHDQCTILARPMPNSNEGLASWSGGMVVSYLASLQTGCRLLLDYGPDVDVTAVLVPQRDDVLDLGGGGELDWRVPRGFDCDESRRCFVEYFSRPGWRDALAAAVGLPEAVIKNLARLPLYRTAHTGPLPASSFRQIESDLPGFHVRTGMACAFGRLFRLSPSASDVVPNLYTEILPALRDPAALVLTVYIRTGRTDDMAMIEQRGPNATGVVKERGMGRLGREIVQCAMRVEGERLNEARKKERERGANEEGGYRRVIWMLVTDTPAVRDVVARMHHEQPVAATSAARKDGDEEGEETIRREVLVTSTRGIHTRPKRGPATSDFSEAVVDWYLMGESDVVVGGGMYSFGITAALRTNRPYYEGFRGCEERVLVS